VLGGKLATQLRTLVRAFRSLAGGSVAFVGQ